MSTCKFTLSAPGKVILFGEHSVLYSKPALATAINKRTFAYFETRKDEVELDFRNLNFDIILSSNKVENCLENIAKLYRNKNEFISSVEAMHDNEILEIIQEEIEKLNGFERYNAPQRVSLKCVFYLLYFLLYFQNKVIGSFKITISSELTIGAGTGSSASFSVCLAATLYKYSQFLFESNFNANEAFSTEQKSVINNWAFACEQIIHGKASGIDNFVCTYGSMITISFTNDELGKIKPNFKSLDDIVPLRILLVNSGINRNTAMMVKKVGELHKRNSLVINHIFQAFGEITTTAANVLSKLKNIEFEIYSEKYKKLFERLEDLVSINHGLLISIGVSHPTLNSIVEIGASCGLKGKLTGAGGGGYAFILVPPYIGDDILDKCKLLLKEGGYGVEDATVGVMGLSINSL